MQCRMQNSACSDLQRLFLKVYTPRSHLLISMREVSVKTIFAGRRSLVATATISFSLLCGIAGIQRPQSPEAVSPPGAAAASPAQSSPSGRVLRLAFDALQVSNLNFTELFEKQKR